jgi:putative sugar O-methyltransferase
VNALFRKWFFNDLENQIQSDKNFRTQVHNLLIDYQLKRFGEDFRLDKVEKGFENRPATSHNDKETIQRICRAYQLSKKVQGESLEEFKESNEWTPIYDQSLNEIIKALSEGDSQYISSAYRNFWRDKCSTGLLGLPLDMKSHFFSGNISKSDLELARRDHFWRLLLWQELCPGTDMRVLESPDIGNPYGFYINNRFLRSGCDYHHYYASLLKRLGGNQERRVVCEIGGGFGGMAYYLLRDWHNVIYIDLDLPENAALTAYYLISAFPNKNIALFGEFEIGSDYGKYDAVILPSFAIKSLRDSSVDFAFNSYSLAEMSQSTVEMYAVEVARLCKQYILHVNHNKDSLVHADNFGFENQGFELIYKTRALWNVARNFEADEFEYLYRKIGL